MGMWQYKVITVSSGDLQPRVNTKPSSAFQTFGARYGGNSSNELPPILENTLDALGENGWEVVGVIPDVQASLGVNGGTIYTRATVIMKRPKQ